MANGVVVNATGRPVAADGGLTAVEVAGDGAAP
jgi:hypothetical protein